LGFGGRKQINLSMASELRVSCQLGTCVRAGRGRALSRRARQPLHRTLRAYFGWQPTPTPPRPTRNQAGSRYELSRQVPLDRRGLATPSRPFALEVPEHAATPTPDRHRSRGRPGRRRLRRQCEETGSAQPATTTTAAPVATTTTVAATTTRKVSIDQQTGNVLKIERDTDNDTDDND
jgi:hypothetical protein